MDSVPIPVQEATAMSNFRLSCCRLFQQHPLVKYRTSTADGRYELRVLLIGSGSRMDTIFQEILVNGQLLDTDLHITFLTTNAARSANALLSKAPELKNYATISRDNIEVNVPETGASYANIQYRTLSKNSDAIEQIISEENAPQFNYIVISTGKDPVNLAYAKTLTAVSDSDCTISYVQNKKPEEALENAYAFGYQKDTEYLAQLEAIAYNLHYSYCKSANDRATNAQIRSAFEEEYNYLSNLEAAMHVQEKLQCCGIDTSDNCLAAEQFAKLIEDDPAIVNRLAALEHRRWMIEKIMKGFTQVSSLDMIYSGPGVTTHDGTNKWHVCLVPCDEVSQLSLVDWKSPAKAHPELDPLDQLSLKLHVKCGQIANNNRELVDESLTVIHNSVERIFKGQEYIVSSMRSMELAISQMWQNKRSALPIYEGNLQTLFDAATTANSSPAFYLQQSLSALNDALAPLKEYISFKDYKDQDRLLIRQIPFALTHKKQPVLMKLLAEKETDSLYTTCQLEPDCAAFVGILSTHNDYLKLKETVANITAFLDQTYPAIAQQYHVILARKMSENHAEKLQLINDRCICQHVVEEINYGTVADVLQNIAESVNADYIDITNGNPLLMMCANNADIPLIAHQSGTMINILNAPEVRYPSPKKVITVKEMFDLSGSVLMEESDSSVLSDLSGRYKKFYNTAKNASNWDTFCKHISGFYKNQKKVVVELPILKATDKTVSKTTTLNTDIAISLMPVFDKLAKRGYLSDVIETSNLANQRSISFKIAGDLAGDAVLNKIHQCVSAYTPTTSYKVNFKGQQPVIIGSDLLIKDLNLPKDKKSEYKQILDGLASSNLLIDYVIDYSKQNDPRFSFQFASKDILSVIQNSGKVLEYYIYYSALLDAHFDDVEMGWHFQHSAAEDSADNELDIICTKGISSLFISAKNVTAKKVSDDASYLKYVIYEISLLADRFGINAKPALAMPEINQFQFNDKTQEWEFSKEVKSAYSRGVYLLGKECFKGDVLGEVLDRIADGRVDWCDFLK